MQFEYFRPQSMNEALRFLADHKKEAMILAGGTDVINGLRTGKQAAKYLVDIGHLADMKGIHPADDGLFIGALAKVRDIERSPLLVDGWRVIAQAAGTLASAQIRNLATIGGNICNASPSADMAPALLVLDSMAEIAGIEERHRVPLDQFFKGPGKTILAPGQILIGFHVGRQLPNTAGYYIKRGVRRAMDCAIVGVAALASTSDGHLSKVRIALGAVAPTPFRAYKAEQFILEQGDLDQTTISKAARIASEACRPIDDVRSRAWYRRRMVEVETNRALGWVAKELKWGEG